MPSNRITAVFFDLGDTLGTPVLSPPPLHLIGFNAFSFGPRILEELKAQGFYLGIISNTGDDPGTTVDQVLAIAGILSFFDEGLRIYSNDVGLEKNSPEIFRQAASRAGLAATPQRCLFVGESAHERDFAAQAGMNVCPHPSLVHEVLAGQHLRFVRITIPPNQASGTWRDVLRQKPLVPLHVSGSHGTVVNAITSQRTVPELMNMRFGVEFLGEPDAPARTQLYILRDDTSAETGFLSDQGEAGRFFANEEDARLVVSTAPEGLIVALPPNRSVSEFHFPNARHGHNVKLMPDPLLLDQGDKGPAGTPHGLTTASAGVTAPVLSAAEIEQLTRITGSTILDRVERYSGQQPLVAGDPERVTSRHISHLANARLVDAVAHEFQTLGQDRLSVRLHQFTHGGRTLYNVEAELAGTSPELVLVTAHLDSTAASSPPYDEAQDPAPGADDDASGLAAVLAIAERFVAMSAGTLLARTVRFVLFNAEEEGLVGSKVYARLQRSSGAPIVAVLQMDMIGYNKVTPRSWEVHAGFSPSLDVERRAVALAQLVRQVTPQVSPQLELPQIYSSSSPDGDPAAGRSDHAPFQEHGYTACVASEDFFVGPGPDTLEAEANPNYHQKGDTFIDAEFAADIARAIAAAAWVTAKVSATSTGSVPATLSHSEVPMTSAREIDTRKIGRALVGGAVRAATPAAAGESGLPAPARRNALTATPVTVSAAVEPDSDKSLVDKAIDFVQRERVSFGFAANNIAEFVPDPVVQRTSAGSAAVHLHQHYRGLPIFQMARTVRFSAQSQVVGAAGDSAPMPEGFRTTPQLSVTDAVLKAAQHVASTGGTYTNQFKETFPLPTVDLDDFQPTIVSSFPLPSQPTVLDKGPFENLIPAYLLVFVQPQEPRLAWHIVLTLPSYEEQYVVMVSADEKAGEILYCRSTVHRASARGNVFEFSPGVADRRLIDFPRPLSDYPAMPITPLAGFPPDWIAQNQTIGNSTRATLNFTSRTLTGTNENGTVVFNPSEATGDDQKLLNIFYFCNYMHDFLFILGFDELAGNFQLVNSTQIGLGHDPVRARAHSGPVNGTANMATGPDGLPPLMNMGLVVSTGRHTAFDADVVFHEYIHGLTNRLVGGPMDANSLEKLQSAGMGEGWSDYFALTIQNFFRTQEKVVAGDWVVLSPEGIRRAPYDDSFPFKYNDLANFPINPNTGLQDEHDIGEVWCAALMMMTRRIRHALGNDQTGYRLAWRMVVDGLKLMQANPTFLDARDVILRALDDLKAVGGISPAIHKIVRKASWEAFAHFGMGVNAFSDDADSLDGITADFTLPAEL